MRCRTMILGLLLAIGLTTLATAAHADVEGVVELGDTTWQEAVAMLERAPDVGLRRLAIATGIAVVWLAAARILVRRRRRTTLTA